MTQKEAVIKALEKLNGVGVLKDITLLALDIEGVDWSNTKNPKANIRRILLTNPKQITPLKNARYELVSYRKKLNQERERVERLENTPTKQAFVLKMLEHIINKYWVDESALKHYYQLFIDLGEGEAAEVIGKMLRKDTDAAKEQLNTLQKLAEALADVANKKTIGTLVMEQNNHGVTPGLTNSKNDQQLLTNG